MTAIDPAQQVAHSRPKRADARRNYEKVIAAAREAFADSGTSASLEEIARRAGVGIGTLYRNFPNRQALLEAVYLDEVGILCRSADELNGMEAWDALVSWLRRFVAYMATKKALAHELLEYHHDISAPFFQSCRGAMFTAGEPLVARAQAEGAIRPDTDFGEIIALVGGIAKIQAEPEQIDHLLQIALDGLRRRD